MDEHPFGRPLEQESEEMRSQYLRTLSRSHLAGPYDWPTPATSETHWWPRWRDPNSGRSMVEHEVDELLDRRTEQDAAPFVSVFFALFSCV